MEEGHLHDRGDTSSRNDPALGDLPCSQKQRAALSLPQKPGNQPVLDLSEVQTILCLSRPQLTAQMLGLIWKQYINR